MAGCASKLTEARDKLERIGVKELNSMIPLVDHIENRSVRIDCQATRSIELTVLTSGLTQLAYPFETGGMKHLDAMVGLVAHKQAMTPVINRDKLRTAQ